jgi:two-component system, cell cycle sensor histidine kinase and response regulator CckA
MEESSSARYRTWPQDLLDAIPAGTLCVGPDGRIAAINAELCSELTLTPEEVSGRRPSDVWHFVDEAGRPLEVEDCPTHEALRTGSDEVIRTLGMRGVSGGLRWVLARARPIRDAQSGEVQGAVATLVDIRGLGEETQLGHPGRALLRKAQELARVGSWELDFARGGYVLSDQALEIYGLTASEFKGDFAQIEPLIHPDDRARMRESQNHLLSFGGKLGPIEYRVVRRDGTERVAWASGELLRDGAGRPIGAVGAVQDITERHRLEARLRQTQRLESITGLAAGVAHDLNNLMQPILMSAALIERSSDPAPFIEEIKLAAQRGALLTQRLLSFAQQQPIQPVPLDINQIIEQVRPLLSRTLGERITLGLSLAPIHGVVMGDSPQIERVLMNLVVNARDAMPAGGRLQISTREIAAADRPEVLQERPELRDRRCIEIAVRDTGTGMSEQVRARAFEPFFTGRPIGSGSGLGLAVVHGVVQEHGGSCLIESELQKGTSVFVVLPLTDGCTRAEPVESRSSKQPMPSQGRTVLLVEDESAIRRLTVQLLEAANYHVLAAKGANEALRMFAEHGNHVDLVLTDLTMPGQGGLELLRQIRQTSPSTRALLMTGYVRDAAGVTDPILSKPFGADELIDAVDAALRGAPAGAEGTVIPNRLQRSH